MSVADDQYTLLHVGLGSFHRAHQAVYTQNLHDLGDTQWSIAGGNIRPDGQSTMDALAAQNGAYTLETVTPQGEYAYQQISAIKTIIPWEKELSSLIKVAAAPNTRIISFTVTEAGYYLDEHDKLDESFDDLRTDLAGDTRCTLYGALEAMLAERMQQNAGAVTLLNCDNLRSNGERFSHGFKQFLTKRNQTDLLAWVEANTSTPNSMVDRITPRPTPDVAERVLAATGRKDDAPIMGESFIQWVIEDEFIAGRPAWEKVGAELVDDVMPYEEAKIRVLNATHSCIAWAGTLKGYQYIHEGTHDADVRQLAYNYVTDDVIPCLDTPEKPCPLNLADYRDVVLDRFGNGNIKDTNQRVAMDGYSKIPGFILPTLVESIAAGRSPDATAVLPALFLAFMQRQQRGEIPFAYEDQGMDEDSVKHFCQADDSIQAFAQDRLLFGSLAGDERLITALRNAMPKVEAL